MYVISIHCMQCTYCTLIFYYQFIYTHLYVHVDTHLFKNVFLVHLSQDNINSQTEGIFDANYFIHLLYT